MNAIILKQTKIHDNDAIVDWFTDEDRPFTTIASHIQGSRAFPNALDLMNVYEIEYATPREGRFPRLKSAYGERRFDNIAKNMQAYACACATFEAISNACPKNSTIVGLFSTLLSTIAVIDTLPEFSTTALAWFECHLLHQLGIMPNLYICAQCAEPFANSAYFQQEIGFFCTKCANHQNNIEPFVIGALRKLHCQSLRDTMQNAIKSQATPQQFLRVLTPILKFLGIVLCDGSLMRNMKAHKFMAETALRAPDLYTSPTPP